MDDCAGVYCNVSWLLVDLLDADYGRGVVDHNTGKAAGIGGMPDLGGCALGGEQFDADLVESVRPAGSVQKKAQPKVGAVRDVVGIDDGVVSGW